MGKAGVRPRCGTIVLPDPAMSTAGEVASSPRNPGPASPGVSSPVLRWFRGAGRQPCIDSLPIHREMVESQGRRRAGHRAVQDTRHRCRSHPPRHALCDIPGGAPGRSYSRQIHPGTPGFLNACPRECSAGKLRPPKLPEPLPAPTRRPTSQHDRRPVHPKGYSGVNGPDHRGRVGRYTRCFTN
jgi:hypothetical protein